MTGTEPTGTPSTDLTDQEILAMTQSIKDSEANRNPLVSKLEPIEELLKEYERGSEFYVKKIRWLEKVEGWSKVRRLRAFAFTYIENLSHLPPSASSSSQEHIESLFPVLESCGFQRDTFEEFYEPLSTLLVTLKTSPSSLTPESLLETFNDPWNSNCIVVFLRLLTSAYLRWKEDEFVPFLFSLEDDPRFFGDGPPSMNDFCQFHVEAVNKEADHIQISALTRALRFALDICYLDQTATTGGGAQEPEGTMRVDFHKFDGEEGVENNKLDKVALLYRE